MSLNGRGAGIGHHHDGRLLTAFGQRRQQRRCRAASRTRRCMTPWKTALNLTPLDNGFAESLLTGQEQAKKTNKLQMKD
jgi:hypothetical protein